MRAALFRHDVENAAGHIDALDDRLARQRACQQARRLDGGPDLVLRRGGGHGHSALEFAADLHGQFDRVGHQQRRVVGRIGLQRRKALAAEQLVLDAFDLLDDDAIIEL